MNALSGVPAAKPSYLPLLALASRNSGSAQEETIGGRRNALIVESSAVVSA
jgi:hypothetical protein